MRRVRVAPVQLGDEVRERDRLAELLEAASPRRRHSRRSQPHDGANRSALRALRRAFGARIRRWPETHGPALLHERPGAAVPRRRNRLGDDPKLSALPRRRIAYHPEFLLKAFEYGTPPHGGIAPGVDRLAMLLCAEPNIREVMAFPKAQNHMDLMLNAPSVVPPQSLEELHLEVVGVEDDASAGQSRL